MGETYKLLGNFIFEKMIEAIEIQNVSLMKMELINEEKAHFQNVDILDFRVDNKSVSEVFINLPVQWLPKFSYNGLDKCIGKRDSRLI